EDGREFVDVRGKLVVPGIIDLHTHTADAITRHSINPDLAGVHSGVTTVVDGGSVGCDTFMALRRYVVPAAATTVYSFIHLGHRGMLRFPEIYDSKDVDLDGLLEMIQRHRDVIKGVKMRAVAPLVDTVGAKAVEMCIQAARAIGAPVMVHIGDHGSSPSAHPVTRQIIDRLEAGDIITHVYTGWPGHIFTDDGKVIPELTQAIERGVILDVARGRMNFSFQTTRRALEAGIIPHTLSTDLTIWTYRGIVFGLTETMSTFLNLGFSIEKVVAMVTVNSAKALNLQNEIGSLKPGAKADVTVLQTAEGDFEFVDAHGETMNGRQAIFPILTVKAGRIFKAEPPPGSAGAQAKALVSM
ncbi:MAG: amidohydrolase family protein, partial [Dehalococcoidia bacterium]